MEQESVNLDTNALENDSVFREALREESGRLYVDSGNSGAGHLQESLRWAKWDSRLGVPAVIASTVLAAGAGVSALLEKDPLITAIPAILAAGLSAARTFMRTDELAEQHGAKGNQYLSIRNEARFFNKVDLASSQNDSVLHGRLRDLRSRYNALNETPPHRISRQSRALAKEGIEAGEMSYEVDALWREITI